MVSKAGVAQVKIYDLSGRLVRTLPVGEIAVGGTYRTEWLGRDDAGRSVSSGTYFGTLEVDGRRSGAPRKMSLVR